MHLLRRVAATLVGVGLLFSAANAHSIERNPLTYLTLIEDSDIHTPSRRVHALSSFDLTFLLHNKQQRVKLTLSPNHDVIAEGATVTYLGPDGGIRSTEPIDRSEHRIFLGQTWLYVDDFGWTNVGWARIMMHHDGLTPVFEGAFRIDGDSHHIQTRTNYLKTKHMDDPAIEDRQQEIMVVWRDSDVRQDKPMELRRGLIEEVSCSADRLSFNQQPEHPVYAAMLKRESSSWGSITPRSLFGRQIDNSTNGNSAGGNLISSIGNSAGCPTTRKVALVGVATDCTYTADFDSQASARANIIQQMNTASQLYESTFNISLGLLNLTINDAKCPATAQASAPWNVGCETVTIQDRLNLFSAWRGARPDGNAYWTLLSKCNTGSAVGLAWLGQACVSGSTTSTSSAGANETVAAANVVVRTSTEWQVIAHETGHTFGAVHDCTSTTCNDGVTVNAQQCCPLSSSTCDASGQFIMNPATAAGISKFSACSLGNICSAFLRNSVKTTCFSANRDVVTITGSQCGNGIVEPGEDCDCGGTSGCGTNSCCNATTCKFKTNAVCDPSNEDCCTKTCQLATNGTVCRASTGVCDPAETCSGTGPTCPADLTADDGTACGNSSQSLSCSSGQCTSRDLQCKTLMGSYTHSNDTYACSSSGCQISCASPEFGSNVCYSMSQNFLDGTSCAGGGRCSNGQCKGATAGGQILSWIDQNKTLVIGLAAGIGGVLVIAILTCIINSCRKHRRRSRMPPAPVSGWNAPVQGWNAPRPQGAWGANGQWIPPSNPPPAMRSTNNLRYNNANWQAPPLYSRPSVRYA